MMAGIAGAKVLRSMTTGQRRPGEKRSSMSETLKLAVPTMGAAGLDSERAGHFGHCDCFTLVDIVDGTIMGVSEVSNPPHEEDGCLRPVGLLVDAGADAIVAAGMGSRPLAGFNQAGLTVYFENRMRVVGDAARLVAEGKASVMGAENACSHHA